MRITQDTAVFFIYKGILIQQIQVLYLMPVYSIYFGQNVGK